MIQENILRVKERISHACSDMRANPQEIALIAVTKGRSAEEIAQAINSGITDIGENRVQEAATKFNELNKQPVKWHLIGHLQGNKVKDAVRIFELIHSVDTLRIAQAIDREAGKINKVQDILIQVNISGEATKFGLRSEDVIGVIGQIGQLKNVRIKGLMTIAPAVDNPEEARPYFKALRELRDKICDLRILSMGMSDDFEIAIKEGANMVRIGRAIFEG